MDNRWRIVTVLLLAALLASWVTAALSPAQAQACAEIVVNGGFETTTGWELGVSPVPPQYVTYTAHTGTHSLQLGITSGANIESFSSARQTVTIPASAAQATLSFWFYAMADSPATTDYMELALLSADGSVILAKPWQSHNDSRVWNQLAFDLSGWQGRTFQLYFNVYNDGTGGEAALFLDDVSLNTCPGPVPSGTVTPTGTRTSTPTLAPASVTPSPTPGCTELIRNGSFNGGLGDWETTGDPGGVALATERYHSSPYALKLGSLDVALNGLAAARQMVTIPAGSPVVTLDVWIFTQSQPGAGADYQEIALLNSMGGLLFVPYRGPANDSAWVRLQFNLAAFAGQTVYLRFAVNNDGVGGRTVMYVDDVRLTACSSGIVPTVAPSATFAPLPTWTPVPTWTPIPDSGRVPIYPTAPLPPPVLPTAPVPAGCAELTQNGGFETGFTPWVAGASQLRPAIVTAPVLSGAYSAQMGLQPDAPSSENLSSYSSIRQTVTVPWGYARTLVSFWTYTWAESTTGADRQQFVLLGPGDVVWATPWKVLENAQAWEQHIFEIVGVAGQSFDLYFGAVNDGAGGRTALYVDEVHLWGCAGDAWPALTSAQAQAGMLAEPQGVQAVPVPQVYPVETLPDMVSAEELAGVRGAVPEMAAPAAEWTVVAIGTVVEPLVAAGATVQTVPVETLEPLVQASVATLVGAAIPQTPAVAASPTPRASRWPPSFLSNLTAKWPPNWPWILLGVLAVVVIIIVIIRVLRR